MPGIYDQVSYDTLARRVLAGDGFSFPTTWWPVTAADAPTAHWSFLYTMYLSAVYAVVGPHPFAARIIQAIVAGIVQPLLAGRLGTRLFGAHVGLAAAGVTAVYGYFVYYAGALMTETFYILAILWALDVASRIDASSPASAKLHVGRTWIGLGLALGAAALLRQLSLLLVPLLFAWLLWRHRQCWKQAIAGLGVTIAVMAVLILPWTVHNYQAFGRFVLLNTNAGYALFWANHPVQGTDFVAILPTEVYQDLVPAELRGLDEAALDQALLRRGVGFILEDPVRYGRLSLSRVKDYFEFWPSSVSTPLSNLARVSSFGLLLPLGMYGLLVAGGRRRPVAREQVAALALLCGFVVVYSVIHLLSWALIRYRLPVDAILAILAGLAVVDLVYRLSSRTERVLAGAVSLRIRGS